MLLVLFMHYLLAPYGGRCVYAFFITHCHSKFCMDMNGVVQFAVTRCTFRPLPQNFLYFFKKFFLYFLTFQEMELSYTFSKNSFSYILGSGTFLNNFLYFEKWNFPSSKNTKSLL